MNPRPWVPARRAAALLPPAISIIGPLGDAHGGVTRTVRPRYSTDSPRTSGPSTASDLVGDPAAGGHVDAEVVVLLASMSDTERVRHPSAADQVQHADLFGEPDGIPQRNRHGGQQDRQLLCPGRDRRGQRQRCGQVAVVGAVVLGEHGQHGAPGLRPRAHVDRRGVQIGGRPGPTGCPHVEPEREHQRPPPPRGGKCRSQRRLT